MSQGKELEMDSMEFKVRELLKEVRLDHSTIAVMDRAVSSIINAIESFPEQSVTADAAPGFVRDLGVPADKVHFTFRRPLSIHVSGSHGIQSIARPDVHVDLLIRMPKECFHEKDYLNHRYHAKRALYLRVIEKSLKSCSAVRETRWTSFQNEARKPILSVFPVVELPELGEFSIRLIPTATSFFDVSKLSLARNNLRAFNQGADTQATPKYNSSILEDMFLEENSEFLKGVFHEWRNMEEALVLLKVWVRNRNSLYSHDCLNGYLISALMSLLTAHCRRRLLDKSMTALHIFRITLKFFVIHLQIHLGLFCFTELPVVEISTLENLTGTLLPAVTLDLTDKCLSLQPDGSSLSDEVVHQVRQAFDVVLYDASSHFNLTFRLAKTAYRELQDEANRTLNCMAKSKHGGFEEIFMTKVDFAAKFDSCLRINLSGNAKACALAFCMDDERWRLCENDVQALLQKGLGDRATLLRVTWRSTPAQWKLEDGFKNFGHEPMLVGMLFSSKETFRVVDIGPSPENKEEAMKFRKFWGEKAELRRYKDGTIAESTVWGCPIWEKHLIVKKITDYVLNRHYNLTKNDIVHVVDQLDFCLRLGGGDPVSNSGALLAAFELLSKRLHLLEDIPLRISSVQCLDPALRHTSVLPPQPHPLAYEKSSNKRPKTVSTSCVRPLDVMIQLEGSGNWPLDRVAVEKTKSAFLLKIGKSLQDHWGTPCIASEKEVNILMSGYAFGLKILHDREINTVGNLGGVDKVKDAPSIDKELFLRSQHSSMINGLHGRYPMYEPVVRLAKRWVSAHLFSCFLVEEAIELVVAYLFLKPFPFHVPCSRITGFLRFLRLLSNFDWAYSPLIVDINEDFTLKDENEIAENFMLNRKSYEENAQNPYPSMFLATTYDKTSEAWTKYSPSRTVLRRIAYYARSSAELLTELIVNGDEGSYTWECLFRTPLNNYDAVVLLHRDKLSYPHHLLFPAEFHDGKLVVSGKASKDFHPYISVGSGATSLEDARNQLMVNFDPARFFLEDIKRELPNTFKVWYDSLGGDVIGLTWEKKDSKKRTRDGEDENIIEPRETLKEVGELGKGLVKSIRLLKTPKL